MKGFEREDLYFSLCGLNCGLCPMQLDGYCPGCGGGAGNQSCPIATCSLTKGKIQYCSACGEFPCKRYPETEEFDSFLPRRNRMRDLKRHEQIGVRAYQKEIEQKRDMLLYLLEHYNDGRKKSLFCVAVNLLELSDLQEIIRELKEKDWADSAVQKEKAAFAASLLHHAAGGRGIELKLRKKPREKKA